MKVKTKSGFECEVPNGVLRDFRFIRARQAVKRSENEDDAQQAALDMVSLVFCDPKEEERFLLHLADQNGRALVEDVFRELWEIIAQVSEKDKKVKNS